MSETENTVEELSTEDKKKAINLQDLKYVKAYIDQNHYKKRETDEQIAAAIEASDKSYTKTEADATFYKRTDTVANAVNAVNAENTQLAEEARYAAVSNLANNATTVNNLEIKKDNNGSVKIGDEIISRKKLISNQTEFSHTFPMEESGYAKYEIVYGTGPENEKHTIIPFLMEGYVFKELCDCTAAPNRIYWYEGTITANSSGHMLQISRKYLDMTISEIISESDVYIKIYEIYGIID